MKVAIVTGASGFVGANLTRKLLANGHRVHLLLRSTQACWRIEEIQNDCQLHAVDLRDGEMLAQTVSQIRPDWIFHLAANGAYSWQTDVDEIINTNILGTINLVRSCAQVGFECFVNTGSSSEYGFKDHPPAEDEHVEPNSFYSVAKTSATMFCRYFAQAQKLKIPTLRLYSVYGPYEEPNRLMPTIIISGLRGQLPQLVDPTIARDYVSADDVCQAYMLAATTEASDFGAVYNVGSGQQTSLKDVVDVACRVLEIKSEPQWGSMANRKWDTSVWVANNDKIKKELGWQLNDDFERGFIKMVDWLKRDASMRKFYESKIETVAKA